MITTICIYRWFLNGVVFDSKSVRGLAIFPLTIIKQNVPVPLLALGLFTLLTSDSEDGHLHSQQLLNSKC